MELSGFPISGPSPLCSVCLEPGRLPSTGITRLQQYYAPLRHPASPGSAAHAAPVGRAHGHVAGLPVLPLSSSFVHAIVNTPAEPTGAYVARFPIDDSLPRVAARSASALQISRPAQRSLALRPARSPSPFRTFYIEGFNRFVTSTVASIASGWSDPWPGGIRTRWKTAPCHGALHRPVRPHLCFFSSIRIAA